MAEAKLNKTRQPQEKRAAGPVEANERPGQEPAKRKRADRLRDADINIAPGILTILDALPFYVLLIDENHHILLANKAVRDQLQVSPEKILGQYCPQAIHGLKGPFPGCPLEEAVSAGASVERELYDERNGRWVNSAVYPTGLKSRDGRNVFFHMTYDITDRKKAEERHKESEQRFKAIFNNASDGIVLADTKSQKFYIGNKMMSQMLGYSQEEIKKLAVMDIHPRKDLPYVLEQFEKQARNEKTLAEDIPVERKDGSVFYADVSSALITLGGKTYLLGVFRDITERKKVEDEQKHTLEVLKDTLSALTQSNKELERFAYVASHDLQEPLRMVASYSQLLARRYKGKLDKDADDFIGYAVDGAVRMQRMINDLLAYSRVGTRGKQFAPTKSEAVLKQATDNLRLAISESGAVISHSPLPEVMADESQLVQLLQNLIGNAIKFRDHKPPRVRISAEERESDWLFSVADNGIGIDPADAERIFLVFQHLHGNKFPGTGIGLAICKKIAARHGGRIWVESALDKGATFHFTISKRQVTDDV